MFVKENEVEEAFDMTDPFKYLVVALEYILRRIFKPTQTFCRDSMSGYR